MPDKKAQLDKNKKPEPANIKQALRQLLPFVFEYKFSIFLVVILLLINSAIIIGVGFGASFIIDDLPDNPLEATEMINKGLQWGLFAVAFGTSVRFLHTYLLARTSILIIESLRRKVFDNITEQSIAFFDRQQSGDMQTRIIADINMVGQFISSQIPANLSSLVRLLGGIVGASIASWSLTLGVVVGLLVLFSPFFLLAPYIRRFSSRVQSATSELGSFTGESFRNAKINHAFNCIPMQKETFASLAQTVVSNNLKKSILEKLISSLINFIAMTGALLLLWYCAQNIYNGGMTVGMLVSFSYFVYMVANAASELVSSVSAFNSAMGAADKVVEYLSLEGQHWPSKTAVAEKADSIEFVNVGFNYPNRPDVQVLKNFNAKIKLGQNIVIVGPSGAGKSTLFELLLRFYQPQSGEIYLGQQAINDLNLESYRSIYGYVPQKESLISGTVLDNVRFGDASLTLEDVRHASKLVGLDQFVLQLPGGYDTDLGEVAARLSGGQKQRLALARAMLKSPRILLLDEANSALDAQSDRQIAAAIKAWAQERNTTVLTIAHRLETAQMADNIMVLSHGVVIDQGTHGDLAGSSEIYKKFIEKITQEKSDEF